MIKLDKIYKQLEDVKNRLEKQIEAIEAKASNKGGDIISVEELDVLDMQGEVASIDCALGFIEEYCDNTDFDLDDDEDDEEEF